jgi:hypothetical protein
VFAPNDPYPRPGSEGHALPVACRTHLVNCEFQIASCEYGDGGLVGQGGEIEQLADRGTQQQETDTGEDEKDEHQTHGGDNVYFFLVSIFDKNPPDSTLSISTWWTE